MSKDLRILTNLNLKILTTLNLENLDNFDSILNALLCTPVQTAIAYKLKMKKRNTPEQDTCSNSGSLWAEAKFQSCTLYYIANRIFTTPVYKFFLHIIPVENKFSEDTNHKCLISIRPLFCRVYDNIFFLL